MFFFFSAFWCQGLKEAPRIEKPCLMLQPRMQHVLPARRWTLTLLPPSPAALFSTSALSLQSDPPSRTARERESGQEHQIQTLSSSSSSASPSRSKTTAVIPDVRQKSYRTPLCACVPVRMWMPVQPLDRTGIASRRCWLGLLRSSAKKF